MAGAKKKYDFVIVDIRKSRLAKKKKKKKLPKEEVFSIQKVPPYGFYEIKKHKMTGPLPMKLKGSWIKYEDAKRTLDAFEM